MIIRKQSSSMTCSKCKHQLVITHIKTMYTDDYEECCANIMCINFENALNILKSRDRQEYKRQLAEQS